MPIKLQIKPLVIALAASGTLSMTISIIANARTAITAPAVSSATNDTVNVGKVNASSGILTESGKLLASTNEKLTKKKIFQSTQSETVISKKQIHSLGPASGAAQALSTAPGVAVRGYAGVATTARYAISVRGVKVGWASVAGDPERSGISILFDGIPMNGLVQNNGSWDSNEIPILQMISGINVIYGPGNPASRWCHSNGNNWRRTKPG